MAPSDFKLAFKHCSVLLAASIVNAACSSDVSPLAQGSTADAGADGSAAETGNLDAPRVGCEGCVVFRGGQLFDGSDTREGTLVVRGDRIESVSYGVVEVVAGEVVDLSGSTLLPGFFDLHVHSPSPAGPYGFYSSAPHLDDNLKAMLRNGVTSYLDLGGNAAMIFELRERIRSGAVMGPRMFAAGPMLTATGGHPCYAGTPESDACRFVDDASEAAAAVDALLPYGPDVIKVIIESGSATWPLPEISSKALLAAREHAFGAGLPVFAHVNEEQDVVKAMDAGIKTIAHMPVADRLTDEVLQRMADEQVTVIPTAAVYDALARIATDALELEDLEHDVPSDVLEALKDPAYMEPSQTAAQAAYYGHWRDNLMYNLQACRQAGVRIVTGTDAGNPATFHGVGVLREMGLYVEAGYQPAEALASATVHAADALGRSDLGRLEPGTLADLVVVEGDPVENIGALKRVRRVWLGGVEVDREALSLTEATSIVVDPVAGVAEGGICLHEGECATDLVCASDNECRAFCSASVTCETGNACVAASTTSWDGYCLSGDGCDPIAQDCENGAACIWVGNAATLCWYAGQGKRGEPCSEFGSCAPGYQCTYETNTCAEICDPTVASVACEDPTAVCIDRSNLAGVTVGECG